MRFEQKEAIRLARNAENITFYEQVASIIGGKHDGVGFEYSRRTRWNNRKPGSGRFPGNGIVRVFGSQVHIALTNPPFYRIIEGRQNALDVLTNLCDK